MENILQPSLLISYYLLCTLITGTLICFSRYRELKKRPGRRNSPAIWVPEIAASILAAMALLFPPLLLLLMLSLALWG